VLAAKLRRFTRCSHASMRDLEDFLKFGVEWAGVVPVGGTDQPADQVMAKRRVRVVLAHLARSVRADRRDAPLRLSRPKLSGDMYKGSTVSAVLAVLTAAGLVRRPPGRSRGSPSQEISPTYVNPALIVAGIEWANWRRENFERGLRGAAAHPIRGRVVLPLDFPDIGAEQALARSVGGQLPNSGTSSVQNLETVFIHTPPRTAVKIFVASGSEVIQANFETSAPVPAHTAPRPAGGAVLQFVRKGKRS